MTRFEYPPLPHARRHGPAGYRDYGSYRDWLRDEFTFRCAYCLHREQWDNQGGMFQVEHLIPTSVDPSGECDYSNLVYSCTKCNAAKQAIEGLPDPCKVAFDDCLRISADGRIHALNADGEKLKQVLRLDSKQRVEIRYRWIRILQALRTLVPDLYGERMGFPKDLPDLRTKQPPENTRPEGALNCYFALRERGELPVTY